MNKNLNIAHMSDFREFVAFIKFLVLKPKLVNDACSQMEQSRKPYVTISGMWIMLMIKSQECPPPHEQVALIELKQAIYLKHLDE